MSLSIDERIKEIIESTPLLQDEYFLRRFPGIGDLAIFLSESLLPFEENDVQIPGPFQRFFQRFGVKDVNGYLELIKQGNTDAIRSYQRLVSILGY